MKRNEKGFSVVEGLLIAVIVGIIGFVGWYIWQSNNNPKDTTSSSNSTPSGSAEDKTETPKINTLSLAESKVTMVMSESWTATQGNDQCRTPVGSDLTCIMGALITPGAKLPTRYGNGTEYFYISVSLYENSKKSSAKTWLETDLQEGVGTGDVKTSSDSINSYDTFHRTQQYDLDGTSVREVDYSFSVNGKAVVIHARTYEPKKLDNGTSVGDFRKFEPEIKKMAESIKINY